MCEATFAHNLAHLYSKSCIYYSHIKIHLNHFTKPTMPRGAKRAHPDPAAALEGAQGPLQQQPVNSPPCTATSPVGTPTFSPSTQPPNSTLPESTLAPAPTPTPSKKKPKSLPAAPSFQPAIADQLRAKALKIQQQLSVLYPSPPIPLQHGSAFQLLVAVMLSAQSTDAKVNIVTPELFGKGPDAAAMAAMEVSEIERIIRVLGLAPTKARNIQRMSQILVEQYGGQVPESFAALEDLPGVGHKTASVVMSQAFGHAAFPVDTHIHRLAQRWRLSNGKSVEQTEHDLKALLPELTWRDMHLQMIYFGREHCPAQRHDTRGCPICSWAAAPTGQSGDRDGNGGSGSGSSPSKIGVMGAALQGKAIRGRAGRSTQQYLTADPESGHCPLQDVKLNGSKSAAKRSNRPSAAPRETRAKYPVDTAAGKAPTTTTVPPANCTHSAPAAVTPGHSGDDFAKSRGPFDVFRAGGHVGNSLPARPKGMITRQASRRLGILGRKI
ncbi:hypothetical protein VaNZ11_005366 [Volvox africanus]|uniref:HhH-GPD domain-containing protein n=1 Tax=Volvox africanus TaxID=51714 RepID=A0ABQ5RYT9_9CHLO|nr:hypothetical protein VaNZ11_005366 [Volvox africanus]